MAHMADDAPKRPYRGQQLWNRTRTTVGMPEGVGYLVEKLGWEAGLSAARLATDWPQVVGEHIASMARPVRIAGRTLVLGVEDNFVAQELSFAGQYILDNVHRYYNEECFDKVSLELIGSQTSQAKSRR